LEIEQGTDLREDRRRERQWGGGSWRRGEMSRLAGRSKMAWVSDWMKRKEGARR